MSGPTEKFEVGKSFRDSLIFCKRVCPTSYSFFLIAIFFALFSFHDKKARLLRFSVSSFNDLGKI
jgi:hypothetical protein